MTLAEADAGMRRLNGSPAGAEETLNVQAALPLNRIMSGVCIPFKWPPRVKGNSLHSTAVAGVLYSCCA